MHSMMYQFNFAAEVDMSSIKETLLMSVIAVEAIYGRARVRLDAGIGVKPIGRTIEISDEGEVSKALARVFVEFLLVEIGEDAFNVNGVSGPLKTRVATGVR